MSIAHWMIVIGIVVLLFGRNRISGLMGDVAQGIKSFKKGMQEDQPATVKPEENAPGRHGSASASPATASTRVADTV